MATSPGFIKEQFESYIRAAYRTRLSHVLQFPQPTNHMRTRGINLARRGAVVPAYVIQANEYIWEPGMRPAYYCLVLLTFDTARMNDRRFMKGIVRQLNHLKGTYQSDPDLAYAANIVTDERAYPDRRQVLPPSMTEGVTVIAADLLLFRARLRDGFLDTHDLTCIADPGYQGSIEVVPWWIVAGHPGVRREQTAAGQILSRGTGVAAGVIGLTVSAGFVMGNLQHVAVPSPAPVSTSTYTASPAYAQTYAPTQAAPPNSYSHLPPASDIQQPDQPQVITVSPEEMRRMEPTPPDPYARVRRYTDPFGNRQRYGQPGRPSLPGPFGRREPGMSGPDTPEVQRPGTPPYTPPTPGAGDDSGAQPPSTYQQPQQGQQGGPDSSPPPDSGVGGQYPQSTPDQNNPNGYGQ